MQCAHTELPGPVGPTGDVEGRKARSVASDNQGLPHRSSPRRCQGSTLIDELHAAVTRR
jgi:hypothetical protein